MLEKVALIIPAAGVGARLSRPQTAGRPERTRQPRKPWLLLGGRPILLRTLERFAAIPSITQRVLVVHPDDAAQVREDWPVELAELKVTDILPGGATRQESVSRGLQALRDDIAIVAVHDAVRPFVSTRAIEESIAKARESGGAVVAARMTATVKRADARGRIVQTIPRENLWMAQTPQTFRREILLAAYDAAAREGVTATDDSYLVERIGHAVMIVEEGPANIKITTPDDLKLAETLLAGPAPPPGS